MKAIVQIKNLSGDEEKKMVLRNLSRILDVKIIDIDVQRGSLFFLYASPHAFQQVKQELSRIGHPIQSCNPPLSNSPVYRSFANDFEKMTT